MADAQDDFDDDDEIFVYMGGNQQVPDGVRRAKFHKSIKIVPAEAFYQRRQLIYVEFHDGIEIIEEAVFAECPSLRSAIKLLGARIIKTQAFFNCECLPGVEFGDKLETIELEAFYGCSSLRNIRIPSVRTVGRWAFGWCCGLTDVEFGDALRTLEDGAFACCIKLERVALPLKSRMIGMCVHHCRELKTVDLVGGIHQTLASLHFESWRSEMNDEINRINQVLPTLSQQKRNGLTVVIQQWMRRATNRLNHFKAEHHKLLKEATTLLELALWKASLDGNNGGEDEREGVRTTKGSRNRARREISVTSGADVVIKNVLPFLQLLE